MIEAHDAATMEDTRPDFSALAAIPCRGVAVTAIGTGDDHVVSRFFAPAVGIPEDAVTGSLPPGNKSGQSFVHDPRSLGQTSVKASIRPSG